MRGEIRGKEKGKRVRQEGQGKKDGSRKKEVKRVQRKTKSFKEKGTEIKTIPR